MTTASEWWVPDLSSGSLTFASVILYFFSKTEKNSSGWLYPVVSHTVHSLLKIQLVANGSESSGVNIFPVSPSQGNCHPPSQACSWGKQLSWFCAAEEFPLPVCLSGSSFLHCALRQVLAARVSWEKCLWAEEDGFKLWGWGPAEYFTLPFGWLFLKSHQLGFYCLSLACRAGAWIPNRVTGPAASASAGSLLEIQILRLYPRLTESETLRMSPRDVISETLRVMLTHAEVGDLLPWASLSSFVK